MSAATKFPPTLKEAPPIRNVRCSGCGRDHNDNNTERRLPEECEKCGAVLGEDSDPEWHKKRAASLHKLAQDAIENYFEWIAGDRLIDFRKRVVAVERIGRLLTEWSREAPTEPSVGDYLDEFEGDAIEGNLNPAIRAQRIGALYDVGPPRIGRRGGIPLPYGNAAFGGGPLNDYGTIMRHAVAGISAPKRGDEARELGALFDGLKEARVELSEAELPFAAAATILPGMEERRERARTWVAAIERKIGAVTREIDPVPQDTKPQENGAPDVEPL